MSDVAIKIENLSKQYRLGVVGTGTLSHDLKRWWTVNMRGKEDPYLKIGETNDRSTKASSEYVWALKDINLEIKKGDVVGIIGKNGAGKSTLLKILSKVTKPTTGTVQYKGRIASLLEVGTGFHMEMTGRENIYMNGSIMGMTRAEITRKLDEIIDFAGVERFIDTPVKRYSSGMTVRLGFAIAAHLEPEILIVDEVLAVGDAEFQKKAIGKMQDVSKGEGRTVLFVSHNMGAVRTLCKNGILLYKGEKYSEGFVDPVINEYKNITSNLTDLVRIDKGVFDLAFHKNKLKDKKSGLLKVNTYCDGISNETFHAGCEFRFDIEIVNPHNYSNVLYGFVIKTLDGEPIIGINNRHLGQCFSVDKNVRIVFQTIIKNFPIYRSGVYSVDLYWGDFTTCHEIIYDAFSFNVECIDVYKTAKIPDPNLNLVLTDSIILQIA